MLSSALDSDTFAVVDSRPSDADLPKRYLVTVRGDHTDEPQSFTQLVSPSQSRTVCVIDRSADVQEAARAIVRARVSFQGRSPYAPDVVLVNEFRQKKFCNAVVQEVTKYFAEQVDAHSNGSVSKKPRQESSSVLEQARNEDGVTELVSGAKGSIFLVKQRTCALMSKKINEPLLLIHAISSLDDAIDLANSGDGPLLASYFFAAPAAAKYLSQFIESYVSCTNQIPIDLLGRRSPKVLNSRSSEGD